MASDKDSEYSPGVGRVMWQLLLLIALVFGVCYFDNNRDNKGSSHDSRSGIIMHTPETNDTNSNPLDFTA